MTARDFFYRPSGSLRAPWQWAGFLLVFTAVAVALFAAVRPLAARVPHHVPALTWWLVLGALWIAHVVMLRVVDRQPWSSVGLARTQAGPSRLAAGLAAGALGICLPSGVLLLVHWLTPNAVPYTGMTWMHFALAMAVFFLPQALSEELLARGYLFATARAAIGWRGALAVTSVGFGLLHLQNPGAGVRSIVLVMLAGVFLGSVLLLTESLYAAWLAHFAWNWSMAAVLHAAVSGLPFAAPVYTIADSGPDWATGGAWGPEGGIGAAFGMGICVWILVAWRRRRVARTTEPERMDSWLSA